MLVSLIILLFPDNSSHEFQVQPLHPLQFKRIIAIGDLHGDFEALEHILSFTNYSQEEILIELGDSINKGNDTKQILNFFIESKENPNIIQLMGNHELLNIMNKTLYVTQADIESFQTLQNRKQEFSEKGKYGEYLRELKIVEKIGDVMFVHGGLSYKIAEQYESIEEINEKKFSDFELIGRNGPLGYRGYALVEDKYELEEVLEKFDCKFMVMGHTTFEKITGLLANKAIFIDIGISKAVKNNPGALEIIELNEKTIAINAIYPDEVKVLLN